MSRFIPISNKHRLPDAHASVKEAPAFDDTAHEAPIFIERAVGARKGRGAVSNVQGRYETVLREEFDDGWQQSGEGKGENAARISADGAEGGDDSEAALPPLRTIVTEERARSILSRNASPDLPFNVSLNPYRGCEHGCVYCFARPSHSYLGLSPGLDFESRLFAKVNAPELLLHELARPSYSPEVITVGINTDAYQPCEREYRLTRRVLEILHDCRHPVALITKSSLVERDIDLLAPMAARRQAIVAVTLTTLDPAIARTLEPRAAAPARRLRVIRTLAEAGIPVSVSIAPMIPFITEPDLERIMAAAVDAGARHAGYVVLRLPWEVSPLFQEWLRAHFPERAQRVMNRIRDMRGGKDYDATFSNRMRGQGVWADLLHQRFEKASQRLGLKHRNGSFGTLDTSQFVAPPRTASARVKAAPENSSGTGQMDLF
ncbi:PA0069 family radical SAM protein [Herbaspirillum lusitanum]|uniref:PA0069 family radical SAM protein n=1 Tax=Herbaspirillum lusitanum TaxID=213312 RepID=A0ABW9A772_9BURK